VGQISGFKSNPKRTAYDVVVQAETGWMHMNGTPNSGPVKMPVALMDVLAAHQLKEGLLLALLERSETGKGKFVEVTLEEAGIASLANQAGNYLMTGHIPQAIGSQHPNIAPYGDTFTCSDGKTLVLAVGSNVQFNKLIHILGADIEIAQSNFKTNQKRVQNRVDLVRFLAPYFARQTRDQLLKSFIKQGVPAGAVRPLNEVFENPVAQQMIVEENIQGMATKRVKTVAF
jgi:crotonobetainyl-CoA:carnitine CoA-transferase CaiB-like acyl-CoA transferase